jgi:uncharacterized protein CbrC (UPF0167 family)
MSQPLPHFRYHPDPLGTGSVEESAATCECCGLARGFAYAGPVYGDAVICPWCIADGRAARQLGAEFTDVGADVPDEVPPPVLEEVSWRTPGFTSFQQDHWLYHCADACAFLGRAGFAQLSEHAGALESLRADLDGLGWDDDEIDAFLDALDADGSACAYLFRCVHCGTHLAYCDAD